jgi:uncharacterized protein (TIGR03437 family)
MKYISLFLLSSIVALPADFMTGQAARITIGQNTFTAQDTGTATAYRVGAISGIAVANNSLVVVDSNRVQADPVQNRVLIFNNISRLVPSPTSELPQGVRCPVCKGTPDSSSADVVLGQSDFTTTDINLTQSGLRTPTGVASDGKILAVADTDNNRILIWKTIPTSNNAPADVVVGQPDFKSGRSGLDNKSLRGPQGVWIQGTRLFVADTQNHRVMVWNNIPTSNGQAADYVLGEPNFNTAPAQTTLVSTPAANNLFSPVSVTSDGQRLMVTDLGHNRILIWNTIPTQTAAPADMVIGQPDMTSDTDNNTPKLCVSTGKDASGNLTYPPRCGATLSFPRFALSDGTRLFVADGGNDRVLVYNTFPAQNGQQADIILGQTDEFTDAVTDSTDTFRPDSNILRSSPNTIRTPLALAFDGTNLFVSDPFDRRVLVFTPGLATVPTTGITNAASRSVFALGSIIFGGTIKAADTVTVTINGSSTPYTYTIVAADTLATVIQNVANLINGKANATPDPNVVATPNPGFNELLLTSKVGGAAGNNITYTVATSASAMITLTAAGGTLSGGQDAAEVAPGTLVTITGDFLSDTTSMGVTGKPDANGFYPTKLAGTEVYFDGIKAPLIMVSPTQITTQIPFEVSDSSGVSAFVRTERSDGSVFSTTAVSVPIVFSNPGIFANEGTDPRPAMATHTSSNAIAVVSVDGIAHANDVATINIEDRVYSYTVQSTDDTALIRDAFITQINANPNEKVIATPSGQFTRIILTAKVAGPDGNGIAITGSNSTNASIIITALNAQTCCASVAGSMVTPDNPAVPGEVISIFATGIGLANAPDGSSVGVTGQVFQGPASNTPGVPVDNAQVGGRTANVLNAGLAPGTLGMYQIDLQISDQLATNPDTQLYIAQSVFTSNIVTIPIVAPASAATTAPAAQANRPNAKNHNRRVTGPK